MHVSGGEGVQWFCVFAVEFLSRIFLVFAEEFGMETDVSGFVDAVDVSESCGDREVGSYFCERRIHVPDIFRLSIQCGIIDASVINTYCQSFISGHGIPSSSPPVIPISISSHCFIGTARLKYFFVSAIFSSFGSSERSTMCELGQFESNREGT